jgi:hypothetical protein
MLAVSFRRSVNLPAFRGFAAVASAGTLLFYLFNFILFSIPISPSSHTFNAFCGQSALRD